MQSEVMFAGFGGQGILLSAKVLAQAAMKAGQEVAWIPSYGPEMRGGTAYCTVVNSDMPIGRQTGGRYSHQPLPDSDRCRSRRRRCHLYTGYRHCQRAGRRPLGQYRCPGGLCRTQ